jgi:hypothetical protein
MEAHRMRLYRAIDVWRRVDDKTAVRYRCFECLPLGGFCVQSADFYSLPLDEAQERDLARQALELLIETAPDERADVHPTLEAAIEAHDRDFA